MSRVALYRRMLRVLLLAARIAWEFILLRRQRQRLPADAYQKHETAVLRRQAVRLRETAVDMGGLLIKLGQFLSTRVDILPEVYTHELAQLQDMVPPVPAAEVRAVIAHELGQPPERVFGAFEDRPVASASFGQVHRAYLRDGTEVAVKVQRPHVAAWVRADLAAVAIVLAAADRWTRWGERVDLDAIYDELRTVTLEELDYLQEAEHAAAFRRNFADQPRITAPEARPDLSTRRVLVMSFHGGLRIDAREAMTAAGIDPKAVSRLLVDCYLKQVLRDGFFHADPHPGNIFVSPDGSLVFVDFGMMGHLAPEDRGTFGKLIGAVISRDLDGLVDAIRTLGFLRPHANLGTLKKALAIALDHLSGVPFSAPTSADFQAFLDEMRDFVYSEPFQLPVQYAYLGRAIGILLGLATALDPDVDFVSLLQASALPYLGLSGTTGESEREGPSTRLDLILRELRDTALLLYRLPRRLERLTERVEAGDLRLQVEMTALYRRLDEQAAATRQLGRAALTGAAAVAGAVFTAGGQAGAAHLAWAATLLLAIWMLRGGGRRRIRPGHGPAGR